jgi:hypothetical protein
MSPKYNLYLGEAGQAAATSYFLARGWNVATPKVDIGDDLFVIEDKEGFFFRIQVKTAQSIENQNSFGARYSLSLKQLQNQYNPDLYYIFMVYRHNEWHHKIIIERSILLTKFSNQKFGSKSGENLILYFSFQENNVFCSGVNLSEFYNNFNDFPIIEH